MLRSILLLPLLFVVSCASHESSSPSASPSASAAASASPAAGTKTMSQKFNGPAVKQTASGEWPDDVKKFSASDSKRQSPYFNSKSSVAKPYKTGEYAKTEWTGKTKEVPKKDYAGNTDANHFHTPSRIQHDGAHETSTTAATLPGDYKTGDYKTSTAHEQGAKRLAKPSNAIVDSRRRVYPEPEVSSWKQQRALDVKATKSILGRAE